MKGYSLMAQENGTSNDNNFTISVGVTSKLSSLVISYSDNIVPSNLAFDKNWCAMTEA